MKLTHDDLIQLLSDALEVEKAQAEKELSEWVETVKGEVSEKGKYHVPGLGVFSRKEGELVFSPEEALAVEVNHKYAGMSPIEIQPASVHKKKALSEELEDVEVTSPTGRAGGWKESEPTESEGAEVQSAGAKPEDTSGTEKAVEGKQSAEPGEKPEAYSSDSKAGTTKTAAKKKKRGVSAKRTKSGNGLWLLPIAAALVLSILLYFYFESQQLDRRYNSDRSATEEPATVPEEQEVGEEPPEHEIQPAGEEEPLPFGLMEPEEEVLYGAYTIVLHSIASENRARIEKENLEEEGYKATFWQTRLPNGNTTWRVGVGQFETVSNAERAVSELPEPYRRNNFIVRIR